MLVEYLQIPVKIGCVFAEIRAPLLWRPLALSESHAQLRKPARRERQGSPIPVKTSSKTRLPPTLRHRLWPSALSESVSTSHQKYIAGIYDANDVCARAQRVEKRADRGAARPQSHDSDVPPERGKTEKSRLPVWARACTAHQSRAATKPNHAAVRKTKFSGANSGAPRGARHFPAPGGRHANGVKSSLMN